MRHLDEGTIHAWLDGALSADEAARAEAHVASCTACADAVAEARGLIAASSRILVALDNVPNVKRARGAEGARGAEWGRRSLTTWLVRERIAAVVALVVAGGALAVALSRGMPRAALVHETSQPMQAIELAGADSSVPRGVAEGDSQKESVPVRPGAGRGAVALQSRARDLASARVEAPPPSVSESVAQPVRTEVAAASPPRTDDTLRSVAIAQLERREEALQRSAEAKSSVGEKFTDVLPRRRAAAEASARFAQPRAAEATTTGAVGAAGGAAEARLLHEERMTEAGREVRRRIYRVEGILVTLDERLPDAVDEVAEVARAPLANAAPPAPVPAPDTASLVTNTIRWTDARGAELTLTGPASQARLEQIKKVLGY